MSSINTFVCVTGLLFTIATVCTGSQPGYFPPYITPCKRSGGDLNECIATQVITALPNFVKGIPELDVPSLDPVKLDNIYVNGIGLKIQFTDGTMQGLSRSTISKLLLNEEKGTFKLNIKTSVIVKAKYVIDGRILILPVTGSGDAKIKAKNLELFVDSSFGTFKDSRGEHYILTAPQYKYEVEKVQFNFQNLFNGNEVLANTTHVFANQNWRQIMKDLGPPVVEQIVQTCLRSINKFFSMTTTKQIYPD